MTKYRYLGINSDECSLGYANFSLGVKRCENLLLGVNSYPLVLNYKRQTSTTQGSSTLYISEQEGISISKGGIQFFYSINTKLGDPFELLILVLYLLILTAIEVKNLIDEYNSLNRTDSAPEGGHGTLSV